jgi:LEA14-like dessication related protein
MKKGLFIVAILGGISLVGYGLYNYFKKQVKLLKDFEWKFLNLRIQNIDLQLIKGVVTIRFTSKSDLEFLVEQFVLDVYVNGEKSGYVNDVKQTLIPANGYTDIDIQFSINPQYLIKDATDILAYTLKKKDALITLSGYVQVSSNFVSTTVPIECDCSIQKLECDCS